MTTGVVVGVDGSAGSRSALAWALQTSVSLGQVTPVTAWQMPWWSATFGGLAAPFRYEQATAHVDALVEEVRAEFSSERLAEAIVVNGGVPTTLIDAAADSALLVVGTRGYGAVGGTILGSVGIACSLRATTPFAVVPESWPKGGHDCVVGIDDSANSLNALVFAMRHASPDSVVKAVHVWGSPAARWRGAPAHALSDLKRKAEDVVSLQVSAALDLAPGAERPESFVVRGDPRAVLERMATGAAMLVVGARSDGGYTGVVLGSVSTALIHRPHCATVLVPSSLVSPDHPSSLTPPTMSSL